jgi:hypothetical protein
MTLIVIGVLCYEAGALTRYVALNGGHVSPFTNGWASAATNIPAAVNVAAPGDTVLVQTGMYRTAAEITVDRAITLASVAGAAKTIVTPKPYTYVGGFNLGSNNCILTGFTISNCSALRGGGVSCLSTNPVSAQCVIVANRGGAFGGGVYYGTVRDSLLLQNQVNDGMLGFGGGAAYSVLDDCVVSGNYARGYNSPAEGGGGFYYCNARNCRLLNNSSLVGGGANGGVLSNCVIAGNRANMTAGMLGTVAYDSLIASNVSTLGHGGVSGGRCERCRLVANVSSNSNYAGGASGATLLNCLLIHNTAVSGYGGASACALVNCTVARNSGNPGGIGGGYLTNSIVYENTAPEINTTGLKAAYSCAPTTLGGAGNITNNPRFVNSVLDDFHLQTDSPCSEAGSDAHAALPWDLDGEPRIQGGHVDMGCYETVPESGSLLAFLIVTICKLRRTHPLQAETLVALNTYHVNPHYLS